MLGFMRQSSQERVDNHLMIESPFTHTKGTRSQEEETMNL